MTERTHTLKTIAPYFELARLGIKRFEIRKNDRNYAVGDTLVLKEWEPAGPTSTDGEPSHVDHFTGRTARVRVLYILRAGDLPPIGSGGFTVPPDYVIMSIAGLPDVAEEPTEKPRSDDTIALAAEDDAELEREVIEARMGSEEHKPAHPAGSRAWLEETEKRLDTEHAVKLRLHSLYGTTEKELDASREAGAIKSLLATNGRQTHDAEIAELAAKMAEGVATTPGPCAATWGGVRCGRLAHKPHPSGLAGAKACEECHPKVMLLAEQEKQRTAKAKPQVKR